MGRSHVGGGPGGISKGRTGSVKEMGCGNGDRRNQIVFIGIHLNRDEIVEEFDGCLLTDAEMQTDWQTLPDSFAWELEE
ncbi:hypothetical protein SDC9_106133 [bioreactor metagenome]|uniref:CobW C-terminal domain-containing protein n=1 Tax=bioreactor metagenome TaxID=1076179 RepID=A0A645B805_9ZZZZ